MHFVTIDAIRINHIIQGSGPPLLMRESCGSDARHQ